MTAFPFILLIFILALAALATGANFDKPADPRKHDTDTIVIGEKPVKLTHAPSSKPTSYPTSTPTMPTSFPSVGNITTSTVEWWEHATWWTLNEEDTIVVIVVGGVVFLTILITIIVFALSSGAAGGKASKARGRKNKKSNNSDDYDANGPVDEETALTGTKAATAGNNVRAPEKSKVPEKPKKGLIQKPGKNFKG